MPYYAPFIAVFTAMNTIEGISIKNK